MVTLTITGGPTIKFPHSDGMNGQVALETAFNDQKAPLKGKKKFIFMLQYYGSALGYLVDMINGTFDTSMFQHNKATPYFFWDFQVNGQDSATGIDKTSINDGDVITFTFEPYPPLANAKPNLTAKFKAKSGN
jgi:hypothetical protein